MKSILGIVTLLFVITTRGYAQAPIAIGLTAGANIAREAFDVQDDTNRSTITGLILTGQTDWPLYGDAVLQDRLSYIQKGVQTSRQTVLDGTQDIRTRLDYIELSLAPKIKFGVHDFKPYLFIGPRLGLLLAANQQVDRRNVSINSDVRSLYNLLDFGFDVGAGFSFPIVQKLYFVADAAYSFGLTNVQSREQQGINQAYSRDLKIQAGFLLEVWNVVHSQE